MPKSLFNGLASKEDAKETESRTEALVSLHIELLRMLISKNVLKPNDVYDIFSNAVEQSSPREEEMLQRIYKLFVEPSDSDSEADLEDEIDEEDDDDSENDS
ncbi:MAG TPA: hypothetical protein VGP08_11885 [Pyrinomonadaceae bacterium]|jgi:hypothetical protein|nr:hypothetical protein [Pyrinomonadaceae bacterium]